MWSDVNILGVYQKICRPIIIKSDLKASYSIAATPRSRDPLSLDHHLIILSVWQGSIKYHF